MYSTKMWNYAPVVLFTYNRLDHTRQTVEALQENVYAEETELYIYSDAPKNEAAAESVRVVREYLHGVTGFKRVEIIERAENWGLARNIIDGVTKIVNEYGKVIVLEDDIVTSKYFLQYMNEGLERYKDEAQVMEISGFAPRMPMSGVPETYFLCFGDCWGWATWDRAWRYFKREPEKCRRSFTPEEIKRFNLDDNTDEFWEQVVANCDGRLYTWAIFWYAAIFKQNGLCLIPNESMVRNCGMDGTGEHCDSNDNYEVVVRNRPIAFFPDKIEENILARHMWCEFYHKQASPAWRRLLQRLKRAIKRKA